MREPLSVHLYGTHVADLHDGPALPELRFTADARDRWGLGSRVMAHKLPVGSQPPHPRVVAVVLSGLLPEGTERTRHAERAGVTADDLFGMIASYGRDTVGALDFRRPRDTVADEELRPVDAAAIRELLTNSERVRQGIYGRDSRTSLPGLQPKIAVARTGEGWSVPVGGALSTHIIKLAAPQGSVAADVVHTEAAVLELASLSGLKAARGWIEEFDGVTTIVVERFDRTVDGGTVGRVHQEDGAQALGINTEDPERKFQRGGRTLPSWAALARVLTDSGTNPTDLLRVITFKHLVGDIDAHAKNISFTHLPDGSVKVAPVYDTAMHLHATGGHDGRSPIEINGKTRMNDIGAADLVDEARTWGMSERLGTRVVAETADALHAALERIDRERHPGVGDGAWDTVFDRVAGVALPGTSTSRGGARRLREPQGRVPRGTPRGGQFAPRTRHTSDIEHG